MCFGVIFNDYGALLLSSSVEVAFDQMVLVFVKLEKCLSVIYIIHVTLFLSYRLLDYVGFRGRGDR